ncbi:NifB/NifX family molybdenum-iron cluster-binding protein [Tepidibacter aestuarii]|uniref:NifB/NifX family molybdenum-iron cluster-binding protein n=1 Tax=Tepidibacter aestuarii TaxID=2925782 RepID=UPI0020BD8D58|nr:NifB/NifX family molybdenum-iron cluster-binding protein [Tepidibacter aestuarii]CAH2212271.1 Diguanylate cyclase [Tepidibacter aestuarii]
MNIAVSAFKENKDSSLDKRFGRCEWFQIYNQEKELIKAVKNEGQISGSGAGVAAAQQIIDEGIDVVITGNLGPNAFKILKKANIKAYKCSDISVEEAVNMLNKGELEEIEAAGKAHHGMNV